MNLNSSRVRIEQIESTTNNGYYSNPIREDNVIDGRFHQVKPLTKQDLINRKINKTLGFFLSIAIAITFVSYYIAMNYEAKLNKLDNEIVRLNSENQDLQAELDRFKSFNNVDTKVGEFNLLQKAERVLEITAMNPTEKTTPTPIKTASNNFGWAIGY